MALRRVREKWPYCRVTPRRRRRFSQSSNRATPRRNMQRETVRDDPSQPSFTNVEPMDSSRQRGGSRRAQGSESEKEKGRGLRPRLFVCTEFGGALRVRVVRASNVLPHLPVSSDAIHRATRDRGGKRRNRQREARGTLCHTNDRRHAG